MSEHPQDDEVWQESFEESVNRIVHGVIHARACGGTVPLLTSNKLEAEQRAAWLRRADFVAPLWVISDTVELEDCFDVPQYSLSLRLPNKGTQQEKETNTNV